MESVSKSSSPLDEFPVVIKLPVQWGDQDSFGHVNNAIYFRWYESARISYLDQTGVAQLAKGRGLGPILARIACNYRLQLHYPDTVCIGARIVSLGNSSFAMEHVAFSESMNAVIADGDSTVVIFDYATNKPCRIPDDARELIEKVEGRSLS